MNLEILQNCINIFSTTGVAIFLFISISEYFRSKEIKKKKLHDHIFNIENQINSLNQKIDWTREINEILKKNIRENKRSIHMLEIKNNRLKNRVDYFKNELNKLKQECKNNNIK